MNSIQIITLACFYKFVDFDVLTRIIYDFSKYNFNGKDRTTLFKHTIAFVGFCDMHDVPTDDIAFGLFNFMFEGCAKKWCHTLYATYIHSFDHFFRELFHVFILYDCKFNNKKIKITKIT